MSYTIENLKLLSQQNKCTIGATALRLQSEEEHTSEDILLERMYETFLVMKQSIKSGLNPSLKSLSGRVGGQSSLLFENLSNFPFMSPFFKKACTYSLAVAENNAAMGRVVAAPTAGACGIIPGVLVAAQEENSLEDKIIVDSLFTAAAIGKVIAEKATISGAQGGCQAECGSAAAMASAALIQLLGGSLSMITSGVSFSFMNTLGLVCDPVGGLVEIPCVYRNVGAIGVVASSSFLALSKIPSPIPADEMIQAMKEVGEAIHPSLRETGEGGCATCPSMLLPLI